MRSASLPAARNHRARRARNGLRLRGRGHPARGAPRLADRGSAGARDLPAGKRTRDSFSQSAGSGAHRGSRAPHAGHSPKSALMRGLRYAFTFISLAALALVLLLAVLRAWAGARARLPP